VITISAHGVARERSDPDMPRTCLILVFAVALALPDAARAVGLGAYSTARLDAIIEHWLVSGNKRRSPAMSVAVGINGELVFARGYGEARPGLPATACTVYHIGSLSKQFTAAAILLLIDRGVKAPRSQARMTLASTPEEFLDRVDKWQVEGAPPITLHGLLTMTSGLPDLIEHPPAQVDPWGRIASSHLLDELRKLPRSAKPKAFAYSNSSYFLLAEIIERVSAANASGPSGFTEFVAAEIISPVGLSGTGFIGKQDAYGSMSAAVPSWRSTPAYRRRPAFVEADWFKGSADMASSAIDLFLWDKALMEDRVISSHSRHLMFSDAVRAGPSKGYGMGWFIEDLPGWDWFSHTGHVPGFTSSNTIARNRRDGTWISISLLTNADGLRELDTLSSVIAHALMEQSSGSP
jgi:CubicO group peptidase (beta-lactamase class C family)